MREIIWLVCERDITENRSCKTGRECEMLSGNQAQREKVAGMV